MANTKAASASRKFVNQGAISLYSALKSATKLCAMETVTFHSKIVRLEHGSQGNILSDLFTQNPWV
jgi:hypothetical protein